MPDTPAVQSPPPIVGVIDPDPVARNGLRALLHRLGVDVSTFYTVLYAVAERNDQRAVAVELLHANPPGNSLGRALDRHVAQRLDK